MREKIINLVPEWSIGLAFFILSIAFVIIVLRRGFKINGKLLSFQTLNPVAVTLAFEKVIETQFNILKIEFKLRLKEQMSYTEDRLKIVQEKTLKVHRHLLIAHGVKTNEVHNCKELKTFEKLIFKLLSKMKDETRDRFAEIYELFTDPDNVNDDYDFVRYAFEQYVDNIIPLMVQDARNYISNEWIENDIVTRRDSWEAMTPALEEIGEIIRDVLITGIKIQLKYSKKVKELKENQQKYIKNLH